MTEYTGRDNRRAVTHEELEKFTEQWVNRVLESIGYDISQPEHRAEIREDHVYVRSLRLGTARAKVAGWGAAISIFVGTALWLFWEAIRAALAGRIH